MATVNNLMTKHVLTAKVDTPFNDVVRTLMNSKIRHLPIINADGTIRGIISASDVLEAFHEMDQFANYYKGFSIERQLNVRDEMSSDVFSVSSDMKIKKAIELMVKNDIHALPIVDDEEIKGILTSHDILKAIYEGKIKV